jgi:hypothetical protein
MGKLKDWLNERPGVAAVEAEDRARRERLATAVFDPRKEVSADAKYIVKNLVLWFLVLPALLALLIWGVGSSLK